MSEPAVVVVGGGVIGQSIAFALAGHGGSVTVVDPHPGSGASSVAAGMLAPVTEATFGEEHQAQLGIRAARRWNAFAAEVEQASGLSIGYRRSGTLLVASDADDAADLLKLLEFHRELDLDSEWLSPSEARRREQLLAPSIRGAIFAADDAQVDNRKLLAALSIAGRRRGVCTVRARVEQILSDDGNVVGVRTSLGVIAASHVVVAAGYATGSLPGIDELTRPPVRPIKGQLIRMRVPHDVPRMALTVRGIVAGSSVYVVPRSDGQVVLGATMEDRGEDRTVTAGALYSLIRDAVRIVPALSEYEITECSAGLRPGSTDNAAIVGPTEIDGLILACGHFRNGVLFAPITADAVCEILECGSVPEWAAPFDPRRLKGPNRSSATLEEVP